MAGRWARYAPVSAYSRDDLRTAPRRLERAKDRSTGQMGLSADHSALALRLRDQISE